MAVASEEQIHDELVAHRIALSRYSTAMVRKIVAQLNRVERDVVERLARADNESITGKRLERLLEEVRNMQAAGWQVVSGRLNADLKDLAQSEAAFAERIVSAVAKVVGVDVFDPAPPVSQVMAAVKARPFSGRLLREWLGQAEEGAAVRVRDAIRQGYIEGQTTPEIVARIRGTRANGYRDGIMEMNRRGAEAMVRTAITHTANVANNEVFKANADIVKKVRWAAVLDSRTTLLCASRDGKEYPIDSGPRPPAHINCRSVCVPVVDPIPGVTPFEPPSYQAWLKKQPASVQDEILGPQKAALFRTGKLPIDRFVDNKGRTLTLDELRAKNEGAFRDLELAAKRAAAPPPFTEADRRAIADYTSDNFADLNRHLRGKQEAGPDFAERIAAIDAMIDKGRLTDDVILYRGVKAEYANQLAQEGLRRGRVIREDAFLSTSRNINEAARFMDEGGIMFSVSARAGQHGVEVSADATFGTGEREILFARGSELLVLDWDDESRTLFVERQPDRR